MKTLATVSDLFNRLKGWGTIKGTVHVVQDQKWTVYTYGGLNIVHCAVRNTKGELVMTVDFLCRDASGVTMEIYDCGKCAAKEFPGEDQLSTIDTDTIPFSKLVNGLK